MGHELDRLRSTISELPEETVPVPVVVHKARISTAINGGPAPFKVVDQKRFLEVALSLGVPRDEISKDNLWKQFDRKRIEQAFGPAIHWT